MTKKKKKKKKVPRSYSAKMTSFLLRRQHAFGKMGLEANYGVCIKMGH